MKYRQYNIVNFYREDNTLLGTSWVIVANTAGLDSSCDLGFPETDLYGKGEYSELFIVQYNNEVVDEIEEIAQCGQLWVPDTKDWPIYKDDKVIDGVPIITHYYKGKRRIKDTRRSINNNKNPNIISWKPLRQLILEQNNEIKQLQDPNTGKSFFVCGKVKGYISPAAEKVLENKDADVADFKVAMVSKEGENPVPCLLTARNPNSKVLRIIDQSIDRSLERGHWRDAVPLIRKNMEECLKDMQWFSEEKYDIFQKHKADDPNVNDTSAILYNAFSNNCVSYLLPTINDLLKLFWEAISDMDGVYPAMNYENQLEDIRNTVNLILEEGCPKD